MIVLVSRIVVDGYDSKPAGHGAGQNSEFLEKYELTMGGPLIHPGFLTSLTLPEYELSPFDRQLPFLRLRKEDSAGLMVCLGQAVQKQVQQLAVLEHGMKKY